MEEPDKETVARLFVDLKSRSPTKSEDWISIAKKVKEVVEWRKSVGTVAQEYGVSPELIRSIITILDLPREVQEMVRHGRLGQDTASKLSPLGDKRKQAEVARIIEGLPQWQQRQVIGYAKRFPNEDLAKFVKRLTVQPKHERIHVAAVLLSEEEFLRLDKARKKKGISLEGLLTEVVRNWMKSELR